MPECGRVHVGDGAKLAIRVGFDTADLAIADTVLEHHVAEAVTVSRRRDVGFVFHAVAIPHDNCGCSFREDEFCSHIVMRVYHRLSHRQALERRLDRSEN